MQTMMMVRRAAAGAACSLAVMTVGGLAGAGEPVGQVDLEAGGVRLWGPARNASCSISTYLAATDGRTHSVEANGVVIAGSRNPETAWPGGASLIVLPADTPLPVTFTIDGVLTVERPTPRYGADGTDCGGEAVTSTTATPTTEAPSTTSTPATATTLEPVTSTTAELVADTCEALNACAVEADEVTAAEPAEPQDVTPPTVEQPAPTPAPATPTSRPTLPATGAGETEGWLAVLAAGLSGVGAAMVRVARRYL